MKKIILIQFFLAFAMSGMQAQDFHLSQYHAAPHYFTPALTGIYMNEKADYAVYSDYRTQWRSFGIKPFSTFYMGYDMPFKDQFGLGGYLISNRNGRGGMNSIQVMPSGAYRITKDKNGEHQLTVGAQIGIIYNTFDPPQYTFESQYNPEGSTVFDETMYSGEYFNKTNILKLDAAMGAFYQYKKSDWKAHPYFGYSVFHLTRPNQSLTGIVKDKLPMRWVYELGADYKVNEKVKLKPSILFMQQAKAHNLIIGATGSYRIKETQYDIQYGLNYRTSDAFIIQAGMKYSQYMVMFSYDINTSSLNDYTNGKGAFEISLRFTGEKGKPVFAPRFKQ